MRKHSGMRPHDIAILAKIIAKHDDDWQNKTLSEELFISSSEISESLNRSRTAMLIDYHKKQVNKQGFLEFVVHGLPFVFPAEPGPLQRGIPTAHSHSFMKQQFDSNTEYVWPDSEGTVVGMVLEPLYANQTKATKVDAQLYKLLALIDVLRIGKVREKDVAKSELQKMLYDDK